MNYTYRKDLDWLVSDFATRVADVAHAAVVSADGVPLALSDQIPEMFAEQLAAITSGLASLMQGAARIFEAGSPTQALVEMEFGLLLLKQISDGSCLCVLASTDCDTDLVSYEMSLLVEAAGEVLSPALRGSHKGLVMEGCRSLAGASAMPTAAATSNPRRHPAPAFRLPCRACPGCSAPAPGRRPAGKPRTAVRHARSGPTDPTGRTALPR